MCVCDGNITKMKRPEIMKFVALAVGMLIMLNQQADAGSNFWSTTSGGDWNVATNWGWNLVPNATDTAWVRGRLNFPLFVATSTNDINNLRIGSNFNEDGQLRIDPGGSLTVSNELSFGQGGPWNNNETNKLEIFGGSLSVKAVNAGNAQPTKCSIWQYGGTFSSSGAMDLSVVTNNVEGFARFYMSGGTCIVGGSLTLGSDVAPSGTGTVSLSGTDFSMTITNNLVLQRNSDLIYNLGTGGVSAINVVGNASFSTNGSRLIINFGTNYIYDYGRISHTLLNLSAGTLSGTNFITGHSDTPPANLSFLNIQPSHKAEVIVENGNDLVLAVLGPPKGTVIMIH